MGTGRLAASLIALSSFSFAWTSPPPRLLKDVPLPGYADEDPRPVRLASEPSPRAFRVPPDEDLRDAPAALPSIPALQAGLRATRLGARLEAIRAAANAGNEKAVPHLAGVMLRLDEPVQVRVEAAAALGRIRAGSAVPALTASLTDPAPEVRTAAAAALAFLPLDPAVLALERVLRADPVWWVRQSAAAAFGRVRKALAIAALLSTLTRDPAWRVRRQAARSLQEIGTPLAAEAAIRGLSDREPRVRAAAALALGSIGGPAQRRAVAAALRRESDSSARAALRMAARALRR